MGTAFLSKGLSIHDHDDRYYTQEQTDNKLATKAEKEHTHNASNISSGTLPTETLPIVPTDKGGTGATTAEGALANLGITATATELNHTKGVTDNIQTQLDDKASITYVNDSLLGVKDYKLLTLGSIEDLTYTEDVTSTVFGQVDSSATPHGTGISKGNQDGSEIPFISSLTAYQFKSGEGTSSGYITYEGVKPTGNTGVSTILERTEYDADYYAIYRHYNGDTGDSTMTLMWDLGYERTFTLNHYFKTTYSGGLKIVGKNNLDDEWTILKSLSVSSTSSSTTAKGTYTPTIPYRYIGIQVTFMASKASNFWIYYMYLSSVQDTLTHIRYKNNYVYDGDIKEYNKILIRTPEEISNEAYVIENTINGINVDFVLKSSKPYELVKILDELKYSSVGFVSGSFSNTSTKIKYIDVGFEPDLVIAYSNQNNKDAINNDISATKRDGSVTPRILTKAYKDTANGYIDGTGFYHKTAGTPTGLTEIYYIAIKF